MSSLIKNIEELTLTGVFYLLIPVIIVVIYHMKSKIKVNKDYCYNKNKLRFNYNDKDYILYMNDDGDLKNVYIRNNYSNCYRELKDNKEIRNVERYINNFILP